MKINKIIFLSAALFSIFCFTTCFSSWSGDEGTITINFGNSARSFISETEYKSFKHEVYLWNTTDGTNIRKAGEFTGSSGTVNASPGVYVISIKGYDSSGLRSYGIAGESINNNRITIKAGSNNSVDIKMNAAVEIIPTWSNKDEYNYQKIIDDAIGYNIKELYIFINNKNNKEYFMIPGTNITNHNGSINITLITENVAKIDVISNSISIISDSKLILRTVEGSNGKLILKSFSFQDALVKISSGGYFEMHNNVEISENLSSTSSTNNGGGVYVETGGTFVMYGGEICKNTATNGGGVYVNGSGTFIMYGGVISRNTANNNGGGVYIKDASFSKTGGIIYGNDVVGNENIAGGDPDTTELGHAIYVVDSFANSLNDRYRDTTVDAATELWCYFRGSSMQYSPDGW